MNISNGTVNRIELRGYVGQEPKVSVVGENTAIRFTMATSEIYKDRTGTIVEETTWHAVTAWAGKDMPPFNTIHKGVVVRVKGRLRNSRYTDRNSGEEKLYWEVLANQISVENDTQEQNGRGGENM